MPTLDSEAPEGSRPDRAARPPGRVGVRRLALAGSGAITGLTRFYGPAHQIARAPAYLLVPSSVLFVAYLLRAVVHIQSGYLTRRATRLCVLFEILLAVTMAALIGWQAISYHPLLFAVITLAIWVTTLFLAIVTLERVEADPELKRGTEALRELPWGRRVHAWLHRGRPLMEAFDVSLGQPTATHQISAYFTGFAAALTVVMSTSFAVAAIGPAATGTANGNNHTIESGSAQAQHAPATASSASPMPKTTATYADLCGHTVSPGDGAPSWARAQLYALWLGRGGAGATQAGCAATAEPVPNGHGTWTVAGYCQGQLQSLAVVSPLHEAALVFQHAADAASQLAADGYLRGATPRRDVQNGDYYQLFTSAGLVTLARQTKTLPAVNEPTPGDAICPGELDANGPADQVDAPYVELNVSATRLWQALIARRHQWVWPVTAAGLDSGYVLVTGAAEEVAVAKIDCDGDDLVSSCHYAPL